MVLGQEHLGDRPQRVGAAVLADDARHVLAHLARRVALQQQAGQAHDGRRVVAIGLADGVALAAQGLVGVAHHLVERPEGVPRVEGAHAGLGEIAIAAVVAEVDRAPEALDGRAVLATAGVDLALEVVEVGEVGIRAQRVREHLEGLVPALQRVERRHDVPQQQRGVVRLQRRQGRERAAEVAERLLVLADPLELDTGIEEGEGVVGSPVDLLHDDRHVAIGLLLGATGRLEVAVVMDLDPDETGGRAPLGVDRPHDLLVEGAGVAVGRAVAEEAERGVDHALDAELLADEVDLAQAVALDVLMVEEVADARAVDQLLVGVEHQDPIARGGLDGGVAGGGEVAPPLLAQDARAERLGDLERAIDRTGVHDHDLVDRLAHALEAARQMLLLVAHDHAQGDPLRGLLLRRVEVRDGEAHAGPSRGRRPPRYRREDVILESIGTWSRQGSKSRAGSSPRGSASVGRSHFMT